MATVCPDCGSPNDGYEGINAKVPSEGAISVCLYCGGMGIFINSPLGLALRPVTDQEHAEIEADPQAQAMLSLVAIVRLAYLAKHPTEQKGKNT